MTLTMSNSPTPVHCHPAHFVSQIRHGMCETPVMEFEVIARQLVRALRNQRSQVALSRRLGYRTNVVYSWEHGRNWPTAAQLLNLADRTGVDVAEALTRFQRQRPAWLGQRNPASPTAVTAMLNHLRGNLPLVELARQTGISRFALARWLKGTAEPKAPDFLNVVHCCTRRVADFVAAFVNPEQVPSLRGEWRRQQMARRAAYEVPWSHAVLRALELAEYGRLVRHRPGWLARRVGISRPEEERCLKLLAQTGQIGFDGKRWQVLAGGAVDLRDDPDAARAQRNFWMRVAAERVATDSGMFAYNVCGVARKDVERLKRLQLDYLRQARAIISESEPVEQVVLLQVQIFALEPSRATSTSRGKRRESASD